MDRLEKEAEQESFWRVGLQEQEDYCNVVSSPMWPEYRTLKLGGVKNKLQMHT